MKIYIYIYNSIVTEVWPMQLDGLKLERRFIQGSVGSLRGWGTWRAARGTAVSSAWQGRTFFMALHSPEAEAPIEKVQLAAAGSSWEQLAAPLLLLRPRVVMVQWSSGFFRIDFYHQKWVVYYR